MNPISIFSHIHDLVHAARTLARPRAFSGVSVISLGFGMGVVIAILLLSYDTLAAATAFGVAALAGLPSVRRAVGVPP